MVNFFSRFIFIKIKILKTLCVSPNWNWHDEDTFDVDARKTRVVFVKLLNDFREDTPIYIKECFKESVIFDTSSRYCFRIVKYFT